MMDWRFVGSPEDSCAHVSCPESRPPQFPSRAELGNDIHEVQIQPDVSLAKVRETVQGAQNRPQEVNTRKFPARVFEIILSLHFLLCKSAENGAKRRLIHYSVPTYMRGNL
jgi:hypothetical protein